MLAGVGCGLFNSLEEAAEMRGHCTTFEPKLEADARERRLVGWSAAVERVVR